MFGVLCGLDKTVVNVLLSSVLPNELGRDIQQNLTSGGLWEGRRVGGRGRKGRREERKEGGKEGGREGRREGRKEGGKEGGREGRREGRREGGREERREGGKEGVNFPSISGIFTLGNSLPPHCNPVFTVEINDGAH